MANLRKGEYVTLAGTAITEFVPVNRSTDAEMVIETDSANSGTIKFTVSDSSPNAAPSMTGIFSVPAGVKFFISVPIGYSLYAQASASNQSFTGSY